MGPSGRAWTDTGRADCSISRVKAEGESRFTIHTSSWAPRSHCCIQTGPGHGNAATQHAAAFPCHRLCGRIGQRLTPTLIPRSRCRGIAVAWWRVDTTAMPDSRGPSPGGTAGALSAPANADEASLVLLERAQAGDREALELLFARYLSPLRRWASGRLPRWARDIADTQDLVQEVVLDTLKRLDLFEPQHDQALRAYLHRAVLNRVKNEFRRRASRPAPAPLEDSSPDPGPSPHDLAVDHEQLERYEAALFRLAPIDREAIVSRLELGLTYDGRGDADRGYPDAAHAPVGEVVG
jgi:RNA polymerase sigma factor (sigma-70 family)